MKIVFLMRNVGYIRNFDTVLQTLLARGHQIEFAIEKDKETPNERPAEERLHEIRSTQPGVNVVPVTQEPMRDRQVHALAELRAVRDYLRYLDPAFRQSADLRARARARVRSRWGRFLSWVEQSEMRCQFVNQLLAFLEKGAPKHDGVRAWLTDRKPDLVCVTPLVALESTQPDYLRAARSLGIPTALCVASWDNLTNKGLIHGEPDNVLVWNEAQKQEAITLHNQPGETVHVTGAHSYDHWFDWQPSRPHAEFLNEVGLDPQRPCLLYLCSSPFIAPNEISFLEEWLAAVRGADDPVLRDANVMIRPHPQNPQPWNLLMQHRGSRVVVYPQAGENPVGQTGRKIYYDSLHSAALVVGINTSALIEAGILGKAVYTVRHPDHSERQEGAVHFHLLKEVEGGLLTIASDFPSHLADLSAALRNPEEGEAKARRFVDAFVRPQGVGVPSATCFADALEMGAKAGPRPLSKPHLAQLVWRALSSQLVWLAGKDKRSNKARLAEQRT